MSPEVACWLSLVPLIRYKFPVSLTLKLAVDNSHGRLLPNPCLFIKCCFSLLPCFPSKSFSMYFETTCSCNSWYKYSVYWLFLFDFSKKLYSLFFEQIAFVLYNVGRVPLHSKRQYGKTHTHTYIYISCQKYYSLWLHDLLSTRGHLLVLPFVTA